IERLGKLAARRGRGAAWWARFLKRLDALEAAHVAREWARLSRQSLGQAAIDLFDPTKNPLARGLPPLASVTPREEALELYFLASSDRARDRRQGGGGLLPTEDLRAAVEDLLRNSAGGPFGVMFADVESVELGERAIEIRFPARPPFAARAELDYVFRGALYRFLLLLPIVRTLLMRPVEEEARSYVLDLLRMVRIPEATKVYGEYPHELSGGMQQRVMIAMALAGEPALMIADEPTTALDVTTQAQILWLLKDLRKRINAAILYITHDLAVIAELSDRVAVMYAGKIVEDSPVADLFREPLHPYTQGLLQSIVSTESRQLEPGSPLPTIPGVVPDLLNPPSGCRFHPRCKFAFERCRIEEPLLLSPSPNRKVA